MGLFAHGVGTVQRRAGEILVVHEAAHERHDLRVAETFGPEGAGLGGLDDGLHLFGHVLAELLDAEFGGAQRTESALVAAGVHLVGAAEVLNVEFAIFGVVNLLADDSPDAGAEVREVGAEVHSVDAVGEGRQR